MLIVIISAILMVGVFGVVYGSALIKKPNKITEYFWGTEEDYK